MDIVKAIEIFFKSPMFAIFVGSLMVFVPVFFMVALPYWTYTDANKRGAYANFWTAVTVVFPFFGWLVYLLMRPREYLDEVKERELEIKSKESLLNKTDLYCPSCHKAVENTFIICPYCRKKLKKACAKCERALTLAWDVCPYCKTPQKEASSK